MSVLIKDMEMPKACWECPLKVHLFQQLWCTPSNKVINRDDNTKREPDCPLVEILPHGRLIDADALKLALRKTMDACVDEDGTLLYSDHLIIDADYDEICNVIDEQPPIIEEEGSRNEQN